MRIESWLGIALILILQNKTEKALEVLRELQTKEPLESAIYELLLECAYTQNDKEAMKVCKGQIRLLNKL
jgi:hypothetical protein